MIVIIAPQGLLELEQVFVCNYSIAQLP
jgi:hypothetical protein